MIEAVNTTNATPRAAATPEAWAMIIAKIEAAQRAAESWSVPSPTSASREVITAAERRFGELVCAVDRLVDEAMATPAPNADAIRWKLNQLADRFADDNQWDELERLVPTVMRDALRFIR